MADLAAPLMAADTGIKRRSSISSAHGHDPKPTDAEAGVHFVTDSIEDLPPLAARDAAAPMGCWATFVLCLFVIISLPPIMLFLVMRQVCAITMIIGNLIAGGYCAHPVNAVNPGDGFVLITGASSGIGASISKMLGRRGYNLILVARRKAALEKLRDDIIHATVNHGDIRVIGADLGKAGSAAALHAQVTKSLGLDVSILINNAGVGFAGPFLAMPIGKIRTMTTLNVTTCVDLMHAFLKPMVAKGRGHVMNVSSIASTSPGPMEATYHATKNYLTAMTRAVNFEIRHTGVSVTAVSPGFTATEFFKAAGAEGAFGHKLPFVTQLSDACAAQGLSAMFAGKSMRITGNFGGFLNWCLTAFFPILPEHFAMWFINLLWADT